MVGTTGLKIEEVFLFSILFIFNLRGEGVDLIHTSNALYYL